MKLTINLASEFFSLVLPWILIKLKNCNEEILAFVNEYRILKQIMPTYNLFKVTTHRPCNKN